MDELGFLKNLVPAYFSTKSNHMPQSNFQKDAKRSEEKRRRGRPPCNRIYTVSRKYLSILFTLHGGPAEKLPDSTAFFNVLQIFGYIVFGTRFYTKNRYVLIVGYMFVQLGKRDSVHSLNGLALVTVLIVVSAMQAFFRTRNI